jgi:hypothetical protein
LVVLTVFVIGSAFLGIRTATSVASEDGIDVTIRYPAIGRRGLATPLTVAVAGASESITIWIDNVYLGQLDHNNWVPEPSEVLAGADRTGLVYEPENGSLEVSLDTRFAPSTPPGRLPLQLSIEGGSTTIDFNLSTWVVP